MFCRIFDSAAELWVNFSKLQVGQAQAACPKLKRAYRIGNFATVEAESGVRNRLGSTFVRTEYRYDLLASGWTR